MSATAFLLPCFFAGRAISHASGRVFHSQTPVVKGVFTENQAHDGLRGVKLSLNQSPALAKLARKQMQLCLRPSSVSTRPVQYDSAK